MVAFTETAVTTVRKDNAYRGIDYGVTLAQKDCVGVTNCVLVCAAVAAQSMVYCVINSLHCSS